MLTKEEFAKQVAITLTAVQDETPIRGNVSASGDKDFDFWCENDIIARLDSGDIWAWASVTVKGTWGGLEATDHLGACSYKNEEEFKDPAMDGLYSEMVETVTDDLWNQAQGILKELTKA